MVSCWDCGHHKICRIARDLVVFSDALYHKNPDGVDQGAVYDAVASVLPLHCKHFIRGKEE